MRRQTGRYSKRWKKVTVEIFIKIDKKKVIKTYRVIWTDLWNFDKRAIENSVTKVTIFLGNISDAIFWFIKEEDQTKPNPKLAENTIFICLKEFTLLLNPCVNVFIYAGCSKNYRDLFFRLFCSAFHKKLGGKTEIPMKKISTVTRTTLQTGLTNTISETETNTKINQ